MEQQHRSPRPRRAPFEPADVAVRRRDPVFLRLPHLNRHSGEGRDLTVSTRRIGEIPAFAGMTKK
jgi:hypothetical protein